MKNFLHDIRKKMRTYPAFVLPFTLVLVGIMLLISVSISTILTKQIYFSTVARESQLAYYAADNAIACAKSIEETYTDEEAQGLFPYNPLDETGPNSTDAQITRMIDVVNDVNAARAGNLLPLLASSPYDIICAQARIFDTLAPTNFFVEPDNYVRILAGTTTEEGKTSSFNMRMDLGDNIYRCAKVTINKTPTFRQIIAQGFSKCDRPSGSIERAIINTQQ